MVSLSCFVAYRYAVYQDLKKMILPLDSLLNTWEWARMRITSTGIIIKGGVSKEIKFTNGYYS